MYMIDFTVLFSWPSILSTIVTD